MIKFIKSEYADAIYYADLFRIGGKVWVIMGYGKSDAARIASNKSVDDDLGRDCIALRNNNGQLEGRYDPGAINPEVIDSGLYDFYKVDHIVYCLSPEQTGSYYGDSAKVIALCDAEVMRELCVIYPYSAYAAMHVFTPDELQYLADDKRRANKFYELMKETYFKGLGIVPYLDTVEDKAELYRRVDQPDA